MLFGGALLVISGVLASELTGGGVALSADAPAGLVGTHGFRLRAESGFVGNQVSNLVLRGGFVLAHGKGRVALGALLVDLASGRVLAPLGKAGAWACLATATVQSRTLRRSAVRIDGKLQLDVCPSAAAALDRRLGTKVFHSGMQLGLLTVGARFRGSEQLPKPATQVPSPPTPAPPPPPPPPPSTTPSPSPPPQPSFNPTLSAAYDKQKDVLTISGSGWDPCDNVVTLFLKKTKIGTAKPNGNGAFDATFSKSGALSGDEVRAEQTPCSGGDISANAKIP